MSYDEYNKQYHTRHEAQHSVDKIQREATKLNALGYDVGNTFDNMRDINRIIPKLETVNIKISEFSEQTKQERKDV